MRDRRDMIRLHIKNGVRDLDEIRESYNMFADGGDAKAVIPYGRQKIGNTVIDKTNATEDQLYINN